MQLRLHCDHMAEISGTAVSLARPLPACVQGGECGVVTLAMPLHARYPHLQQPQQPAAGLLAAALSAVAVAELPLPHVLMRCPGRGGRPAAWQAAQLQVRHADDLAAGMVARWEMPAGNLQHAPLVAAGTVAAVASGVAAVLLALCRPAPQSRQQPAQRRKQQ